ncbi:hypothetical protein BD626DRAFT_364061, partial [Schizophyllum amplum]
CPIHKLPTELLCTIFLMCGETNRIFDYPQDERVIARPTERPRRQPSRYSRSSVLFGYVCSRWLTITRGCPQLWTLIDIAMPEACDIVALKLCLDNSAKLPLSLRMDDRFSSPRSEEKSAICSATCLRFMNLVAFAAHRWAEISIFWAEYTPRPIILAAPLFSVPAGSFRSLVRATVDLSAERDSNSSASKGLWRTFNGSTALRTVRLQSYDQWQGVYIYVAVLGSLRLQSLTSLGVKDVLPEHVMDLLKRCPALESFQAVVSTALGSNKGDLIPIVKKPISLSQLKVLILSGQRSFGNLFKGIKVPLLNRLDLSNAGVQADLIEDMLTRSNAQLRMLSIWQGVKHDGVPKEIMALLRCAALRQLKIFRY